MSPLGFFLRPGKEKEKIGAFIFRGAYATIAIIVSPFGLLRYLNPLNLLNLLNLLNPLNLINHQNLLNPLNHLNLLNPLNLLILFIPDLLPNEIRESLFFSLDSITTFKNMALEKI